MPAVNCAAMPSRGFRLHFEALPQFPPYSKLDNAASPRLFRWWARPFYFSSGGSLSGARLILLAPHPSSREQLNCGLRLRRAERQQRMLAPA